VSWKDEYKRALTKFVIERGTIVRNDGDDGYYGIIAHDWDKVRNHLKTCRVDYTKTGEIYDVSWTEFAGTFASSDYDKVGSEVEVTCKCGVINGRKIRYEGGFAEMIKEITKD
jgi:hypothetical protein